MTYPLTSFLVIFCIWYFYDVVRRKRCIFIFQLIQKDKIWWNSDPKGFAITEFFSSMLFFFKKLVHLILVSYKTTGNYKCNGEVFYLTHGSKKMKEREREKDKEREVARKRGIHKMMASSQQ